MQPYITNPQPNKVDCSKTSRKEAGFATPIDSNINRMVGQRWDHQRLDAALLVTKLLHFHHHTQVRTLLVALDLP